MILINDLGVRINFFQMFQRIIWLNILRVLINIKWWNACLGSYRPSAITLHKVCENTAFQFSWYGRIRFSENPYSRIFYTVSFLLKVNSTISSCNPSHPVCNYMFKVNSRNTRTRCELCSKLTIKTHFTPCSSVSIINLEQVNVGRVRTSNLQNIMARVQVFV